MGGQARREAGRRGEQKPVDAAWSEGREQACESGGGNTEAVSHLRGRPLLANEECHS